MTNDEFKGVRFVLKDSTTDCYDPVEYPSGLTEDEKEYIIDNTRHIYHVDKSSVAEWSWYEICQKCGREVEDNAECQYCIVDNS